MVPKRATSRIASFTGSGVVLAGCLAAAVLLTGCPPAEEPLDVGRETFSLQVDLANFTPHMSQKIEARLVDVTTGAEVDRVTATGNVEVILSFPNSLDEGGSYRVDFYADFDMSNEYTPPVGDPAESFPDHQWRITGESDVEGAAGLNNASADVHITFPHNTRFTDVDWPGYEANGGTSTHTVRLDLTSFRPHVGQKIEGRVVDMADEREVARAVVVGDVAVSLDFGRVLSEGASYRIDFYADLDNNDSYTPPVGDPATSYPDHQWRITGDSTADGASGLTAVTSNVVITFPHSANWVDIDWP